MSNHWFRSWHGAPTDPKWIAIARRASERNRTQANAANAGMVSAVFWALLDHASQTSERGDVSGFDVESYAAFSGFDEACVAAIIEAMKDKELIKNNRLKEWDKRQPKREDGSAERAKEWRERKRTQANAKEHRGEERREEKKDISALRAEAAGESEKSSRRKPKLSLPDDFAASEADFEFGRNHGLSDAEMGRELERFRLHARENDRRCADWHSALRKWFLKASEFLGKTPPQQRAQIDWERHVLNYKTSISRGAFNWPMKLGPEPGYSGCRVPPDVLEKHGFGKTAA